MGPPVIAERSMLRCKCYIDVLGGTNAGMMDGAVFVHGHSGKPSTNVVEPITIKLRQGSRGRSLQHVTLRQPRARGKQDRDTLIADSAIASAETSHGWFAREI